MNFRICNCVRLVALDTIGAALPWSQHTHHHQVLEMNASLTFSGAATCTTWCDTRRVFLQLLLPVLCLLLPAALGPVQPCDSCILFDTVDTDNKHLF